MAVSINAVTVTPSSTTIGEQVTVVVSAEEVTWNTIKSQFSNWNDIKTNLNNWNAVKNYVKYGGI